ncbi:hypothetical protein D9758_012328 [Tetrapyrgos nigripes]|uniref:Uncharacterized protein n=1 Tax=Tetrapyrgos nigripes TaxID=182062 RepID=A0A8H5CM76_9AGAR|nr:hypothetical protein D9758_012328 [Tetrapyrgos nigripes]
MAKDGSVVEANKNIITPNLLQQLSVPGTSNIPANRSFLVPKLNHIWLKVNGVSFDETAFVDMVLSRWLARDVGGHVADAVGLKQLAAADICVFGREIDEKVWNRLDCVKASGMKVKLWDEDFPEMGMRNMRAWA